MIHPYIYVGVEETPVFTMTPKEAIKNLSEIIARILDVYPTDIIGRSRKRSMVIGRQMIFYTLKKHYLITLKQIGLLMNNRDHATIINGLENHKQDYKHDEKYKRLYDYVLNQHINRW